MLAGLAAAGFAEGPSFRIRRYNALGDAVTLSSIAQAIIGGDDDLVITISTACLQAVAAANRDVKRPHVFGVVSDPAASGVGIARDDPRKHLPYMVGVGTMQPVADTFRMARRMAPGLKRVGVAWNPSEANSEACTKVARTVCKEVGIELIEATVDGSASVRDAAASLVARGAEAIWVGGDATVLVSLDAVIAPAARFGRAGFHQHLWMCRPWKPVRSGIGFLPGRRADRRAGSSRLRGHIAGRYVDRVRDASRTLDQPNRP